MKKVKGFISEYDGRELSFDEYFKAIENGEEPNGLPLSVVKAIAKDIQENNNVVEKENHLRVTSLTGCPRKMWFQYNMESIQEYVYARRYYAMFRGTIGHKVMEETDPEKNERREELFKLDVNYGEKKYVITGHPDSILVDKGRIIDYKTTENIPEYGIWKGHEVQLNIYRYLVENHIRNFEGNKKFLINDLRVVYISMNDAKEKRVKLWTDDEVIEYLLERIKIIDNNEIPEGKFGALCRYCDFTDECQKATMEDIVDTVADKVCNNSQIRRDTIISKLRKLVQ